MRTMKTLLYGTALTVAGLVLQAGAFSIGDIDYLGAVIDGLPPSTANEVDYINSLITVAPGAVAVLPDTHSDGAPETYDRTLSTLAGPFPAADITGAARDETGVVTIDATGYVYVLAKYGRDGIHAWFANGTAGVVSLPPRFDGTTGGAGLSHISLYNQVSVPDGGATLMLLGMVLSGIELVRRRR